LAISLDDPVSEIPFVGPLYQKRLKKLEIETVEDLLHHIPSRYVDFRHTSQISKLRAGEVVTVQGQLVSITNIKTKTSKLMQIGKFSDGEDAINIMWFNQPYLLRSLKPGTILSVSGKVSFWQKKLCFIAPQYEKLVDDQPVHTGRIVPIYHETSGLSSKWIRSRVNYLLQCIDTLILDDFIPKKQLTDLELQDYKSSITAIHKPADSNDAKLARERLAFNELLKIQLENNFNRIKWEKYKKSHQINVSKKDIELFLSKMPFELTKSQTRSIEEIVKDLKDIPPMNRLLEGDVGSGKTVVAAFAAYASHKNRLQSVFMAPTQILAQQHYDTLKGLLKPFNIKVSLITSSGIKKDFDEEDLIIGTHALIFKKANFEEVGLVVIDEQHRFGVKQRALLAEKAEKSGKAPNVLTMTATPIPRTVALTLYGDLDLSTLDEMPKGRQKITTWIVPPKKRDSAYEWIANEIKKEKSQAFVVCPLIEESEAESLKTVKSAIKQFEGLKKIFKNYKLGLMHGRLKVKEKDEVIADFRAKKIDILVSTPVVEVGVDIPNATIMLIETADRFGLAQLHQLRGRVGRGAKKSYCLLFTENTSKKVQNRLEALKSAQNGRELAEIDLSMRGAGEVFGIKQHGIGELKIANWQDIDLIKKSRKFADEIVANQKSHQKIIQYFQKMRKVDN